MLFVAVAAGAASASVAGIVVLVLLASLRAQTEVQKWNTSRYGDPDKSDIYIALAGDLPIEMMHC